jgi:hypothetical protein
MMPNPIAWSHQICAVEPYMMDKKLGTAKMMKKASFFSKKPGSTWW